MNELDLKILFITAILLFIAVAIDKQQARKFCVLASIAIFFIGILTNHLIII